MTKPPRWPIWCKEVTALLWGNFVNNHIDSTLGPLSSYCKTVMSAWIKSNKIRRRKTPAVQNIYKLSSSNVLSVDQLIAKSNPFSSPQYWDDAAHFNLISYIQYWTFVHIVHLLHRIPNKNLLINHWHVHTFDKSKCNSGFSDQPHRASDFMCILLSSSIYLNNSTPNIS